MRRFTIASLLIVTAFLSARASYGDTVIASNMGPFNAFNFWDSWQVSGASNSVNPGEESLGVSFTPAANFTLSQILVPFNGDFFQSTNDVEIAIDSSVNGLPGASLESWSVSAGQAAATLYTLSSKLDDSVKKWNDVLDHGVAACRRHVRRLELEWERHGPYGR
jgi:hypothetical protein